MNDLHCLGAVSRFSRFLAVGSKDVGCLENTTSIRSGAMGPPTVEA